MPWRAPGVGPYHIWISEIMLQQTTVQAVLPYYQNFIQRWPSVYLLARATLDEILCAWQGLGYYTRARSLYRCAHIVIQDHQGQFPSQRTDLEKLPGIGPYTAAAIAAIAFNQKEAAVDGNVIRVLSRYFALDTPWAQLKPRVAEKAQVVLSPTRPGDHTQALMDLGATICRPKNPTCVFCPLKGSCRAQASGNPAAFPQRPIRRPLPQKTGAIFWTQRPDGHILLEKYPAHGLLGGLTGLPSTPWDTCLPSQLPFPYPGLWQKISPIVHHTFTHFKLLLHVWVGYIQKNEVDGLWVHPDNFGQYPFGTCIQKVIQTVREQQSQYKR